MSQYFAETNGESSKKLFNKRFLYRTVIREGKNTNLVQMDVAEKIFYGRLDQRFIPITPKRSELSNIVSTVDDTTQLSAFNFVVDLFEQLAQQFKKCAQRGQLSNDPFLNNLKAYKAFDDPLELYKQYRDIDFNSIAGLLISDQIRITSFDEMISTLMPIFKTTLISKPITYTGFVKSRECSVMSTGLAIEIAAADYINDHEKIQNFKKSPNWEFYVRTCSSYGFMVDVNVPWRIIVDLESISALQACSQYITTTSAYETLSKYFINSSEYAFSFFKYTLDLLYNTIAVPFNDVEVCFGGVLFKKTVYPDQYTFEEFTSKYNDRYFLALYTKLRIYEEMPDLPSETCDRVTKKVLDSYENNQNTDYLFDFLESQINKTLDKTGSASYLIEGADKRRLQNFESGELSNITITEGENDFSGYWR